MTAAPRILFVDDEPALLQAIQRSMRQLRRSWVVSCAADPHAALALLAEEAVDFVVSDMRMPSMDGATLLQRASAIHPHTIRIILSGQTDVDAAIRSVLVAHQFLSKPCPPGTLLEHIERAHGALSALDPETRRRVLDLDQLPCQESSVRSLEEAIASPHATTESITDIVVADVGMTIRVLQLVSSSFFCADSRLQCAREATSRLGKKLVHDLLLRGAFRAGPHAAARSGTDPLGPAVAAMLGALLGSRAHEDAASRAFLALRGLQ